MFERFRSGMFIAVMTIAGMPGHAAEWYVAPADRGGRDTNSGTISAPFASLRYASSKAMAGDTIWVRGGVYYPDREEQIHGRGNATVGPVVVRAYGTEVPIIDGSRQPGRLGEKGTNTVVITGAYLHVSGLQIRNSWGTGLALWDAHQVVLTGNTVQRSQYAGIWVGGNSQFVTIQANNIDDNCLMNQARALNGGWPAGISLEAVRNVTLRANQVRRNYGEGIGLVSAEQVTVAGNRVLDNFSVGIYCDNCASSTIDGNFVAAGNVNYYRKGEPSTCIAVANEVSAVKLNDVVISNGVYVNCRNAFEYGKWQYIVGGGMRRFSFVNNTAYGSTGPMLKIDQDQGHSANVFANNIFYQSGSAPMSAITATQGAAGFDFHNNAWFGGSAGAAAGRADLNGDPQLVRPGTLEPRDYRLRSDSRAASAGAALTSVLQDYDGIPRTNPYSVGAFELANRVSNAEFESGVLYPWRAYGSASVTGSGARSGRYAAVITTYNGAEGGFEQSISGLKPNTTYTLRAWLRVNTAGEAVFLGQKSAGTRETSVAVTSTSWTAAKHRFQTGPNSTSAIIYMYKPSGTSPAFGDEFELLEGAH